MPVKAEHFTLLMVEGKEEELFFGALIKHLGAQKTQIMTIDGKEQLRRHLRALVVSPGFSEVVILGVVRDANADPDVAFQSVPNTLKDTNDERISILRMASP